MPPGPRYRAVDWVRIGLTIFVLCFFVFIIGPIAVVVAVSFSADSFIVFPFAHMSLRWYARIVEYRPFIDSLVVSIEVAVTSASIATAIAVPAALGLARARHPFAVAATAFLLSPVSIPAIVLGFSLLYYLARLGLGTALTALVIAHTIVSIPYISRTVIAAYRGLSPDLEEAAAALGAGPLARFRLVTLPLIRPGIFAGALFAILISLDNLSLSFFFGTATINTLPVVMLSYMQNQFDPAIAAVSTVQMCIAAFVLLIVERFFGLQRLIVT